MLGKVAVSGCFCHSCLQMCVALNGYILYAAFYLNTDAPNAMQLVVKEPCLDIVLMMIVSKCVAIYDVFVEHVSA